jgi:hypothetical protein
VQKFLNLNKIIFYFKKKSRDAFEQVFCELIIDQQMGHLSLLSPEPPKSWRPKSQNILEKVV